MTTNQTTAQQEKPTRPLLLTVMCILTFIGSSFIIISTVISYISMQNMSAEMQAIMGDMIQTTQNDLLIKLIVGVIGSIICLVGAIMMWKLKKVGFYMYCLGTIIPLIISYFIPSKNLLFGDSSIAFGGLMAFILITLYGLNWDSLE